MINYPPLLPVGSNANPVKKKSSRRVVAASATDKRKAHLQEDHRRMRDRRTRRGAKQLVDRRTGPERRRPSIDLSV